MRKKEKCFIFVKKNRRPECGWGIDQKEIEKEACNNKLLHRMCNLVFIEYRSG